MEIPASVEHKNRRQRLVGSFIAGLRLVKHQLANSDQNPHEGQLRGRNMPAIYRQQQLVEELPAQSNSEKLPGQQSLPARLKRAVAILIGRESAAATAATQYQGMLDKGLRQQSAILAEESPWTLIESRELAPGEFESGFITECFGHTPVEEVNNFRPRS